MIFNMEKYFNFIKIVGVLVLAYLIVTTIGIRLFEVNSPALNMQYIASLKEIPSQVKVNLLAFTTMFQQRDTQTEIDTFKKKTGVVEMAISKEEQAKKIDSIAQTTNPAPNTVFDYVSKGVAASTPDKDGRVVLRLDEATQKNIEYKQFTRPDGTVLEIMILK